MKKALLILVLMLAFSLPVFAGSSSSSMRCSDGNDLIVVGDSLLKLIQCLGEPAYKNVVQVTTRNKNVKVENPVEEWFYSIDDWTYKITVKNGAVVNITNMGRN